MNRKILAVILCLVIGVYLVMPTFLGFMPRNFLGLNVELQKREDLKTATFLVTIISTAPWPIAFQGVKDQALVNSAIGVQFFEGPPRLPNSFTLPPFGRLSYSLYVTLIQWGYPTGFPSIDALTVIIGGEIGFFFSSWRAFTLTGRW